MIETGTPDELKRSILGSVYWTPLQSDCITVKKAFEAQGVKVTQCFITNGVLSVKGFAGSRFQTIKVYFQTKRGVEGAMAKSMRAIRAVRLAMFQFTDETPGMSHDSVKVYSVEMRGYD
jgi:hypothetical protein